MQNRKIYSTKISLLVCRQAGIHWNPCKENKLAELPEQYIHSSARKQRNISGKSFMEPRDIDLTKTL